MKKRGKLNKECRAKFLAALGDGSTIKDAAAAAGASRQAFHNLRDRDPAFRDAWEQAEQRGNDAIIDEIRRRGVEGYDEAVRYQGKVVGVVRKYSDILLLALANARIPGFRSDSAVSINVHQNPEPHTRREREVAKWLIFAANKRLRDDLQAYPELRHADTSLLLRRYINESLLERGIDMQIPLEPPPLPALPAKVIEMPKDNETDSPIRNVIDRKEQGF